MGPRVNASERKSEDHVLCILSNLLASVAIRIVHYHIKSIIVLNITNIEGLYEEFLVVLAKPRVNKSTAHSSKSIKTNEQNSIYITNYCTYSNSPRNKSYFMGKGLIWAEADTERYGIKTARQWKDEGRRSDVEKGYCLVRQCGYKIKGNIWEWSERAQTASVGNLVYWYPNNYTWKYVMWYLMR